jgi:hypothetical protein
MSKNIFTAMETARGVVIGMADGLTVAFALASIAGLHQRRFVIDVGQSRSTAEVYC